MVSASPGDNEEPTRGPKVPAGRQKPTRRTAEAIGTVQTDQTRGRLEAPSTDERAAWTRASERRERRPFRGENGKIARCLRELEAVGDLKEKRKKGTATSWKRANEAGVPPCPLLSLRTSFGCFVSICTSVDERGVTPGEGRTLCPHGRYGCMR